MSDLHCFLCSGQCCLWQSAPQYWEHAGENVCIYSWLVALGFALTTTSLQLAHVFVAGLVQEKPFAVQWAQRGEERVVSAMMRMVAMLDVFGRVAGLTSEF